MNKHFTNGALYITATGTPTLFNPPLSFQVKMQEVVVADEKHVSGVEPVVAAVIISLSPLYLLAPPSASADIVHAVVAKNVKKAGAMGHLFRLDRTHPHQLLALVLGLIGYRASTALL